MKKQLLFATTFASTIFAQDGYKESYQPVCDPCCDRWGIVVDAEFLYWYAKENKLQLALELETSVATDGPASGGAASPASYPVKDHYMDSAWDPGARVGVGFDALCSCWDLYVTWTGYWNTNTRKETVPPFSSDQFSILPNAGARYFVSPWNYPIEFAEVAIEFGFYLDQVDARWKLNYQVVDLEFGRLICFTPCFHLRPYFGLRAGWTDIDFDVFQRGRLQVASQENLALYDDAFSNKYWGVGFLGGLQPTWYFSRCFGLYGQMDFALLWGEFDGKRRESWQQLQNNGLVRKNQWSADNKFYGMQSIFDLGIGVRFRDSYCCKRYQLTVDLGWEHHLWIHHVHRIQIDNVLLSNIDVSTSVNALQNNKEIATDLALGGFVLRAQFGF